MKCVMSLSSLPIHERILLTIGMKTSLAILDNLFGSQSTSENKMLSGSENILPSHSFSRLESESISPRLAFSQLGIRTSSIIFFTNASPAMVFPSL